jgi:integrase
VAEYQAKRLPELRPDTRAATIRELGLMADAWAGRALRSISRADVRKLIDDAQMRGPAAANMVRNRVSAFLSWCAERDLIESSPAAGIKRPNKPVTRDRVLSDAELAAVWRGAHSTGRCGAAVQLLILTGCRRSEVYQLEWTEVGADAISLPAARTKSNVARSIPITRAMRAILDAQGATGRYVFGAHRPVPSGAWCKTMLDAAVAPGAVAPWTIHDLRRTFATGCAALGVAPHIIERAIGHSVGSTVMQIYQRFEHGPEVADAFARWSEHVQKITRP